ncbi:DUF3857 domain-containing protein [Solitalea sp. MAHUQ-68]|uniref:DUF3857 domain-containing protein n=1 Tax=Solitalea agri TaxID=2953739 RepID=A0A9X2JDS1_9SPHI|nr:DUF3857 domain-containing protein [Solitalea agri]MCO4294443.1 DUF3857 domain-containing protein [Solitalea agri]
MSRTLLRLFLIISLSVNLSNYALANQKIVTGPKPNWLRPFNEQSATTNKNQISDGYYLKLFEQQIHVDKKTAYMHYISEIVSQSGVQNGSQVSVQYNPSFEKLIFHSLTIKRNGEVINKLDPGKFKIIQNEEDLSLFMYYGYYTAYIILDDVRKGDQIDYSYSIIGENPIFQNKYSNDFYFKGSSPISNLFISLQFNPERKLNFKSFNNAPQAKITKQNGTTCYEWSSSAVAPSISEEYSPVWYNDLPHIQVAEYANWDEVVNWAIKLNDYNKPVSKELQKKIDELKKVSKDQKEYAQNCIRFVQDEIRYMGIEIGVYSHKPNDPSITFKNRHGDCKDKSLLLCTLLKANDIPAYMAYANTYSREKTREFLPSATVFNHAVVVAEVMNASVFIDPTIANQRGDLFGLAFPNYGFALIIKEGNQKLTTIPKLLPGLCSVKEEFRLGKKNSEAILSIVTQYKDNTADEARDRFANESTSELEQNYSEYYSKLYGGLEVVEPLKFTDDQESNTFTTYEKYRIRDFWKTDKETNLLKSKLYASAIKDQLPIISNTARKSPIALNYPYYLEYDINIETPSPISVDNSIVSIEKPEYRFRLNPWASGNFINLHYSFETLQNSVYPYKIEEYLKDVENIYDNLEYTLTSSPKGVITNSISWSCIIVTILILGGLIYFALKLYRYSLPYSHDSYEDILPIGGWLILIAMGLCINPFLLIFSMINDGYFTSWNSLSHTNWSTITLFIYEYVGRLFFIVFSILLLPLFFKRRNTFPKIMIIFLGSNVAFLIIDVLAGLIIAPQNNRIWEIVQSREFISQILRAAIWIPYFIFSSRVNFTFVYPHPDFEQEDLETEETGSELEQLN